MTATFGLWLGNGKTFTQLGNALGTTYTVQLTNRALDEVPQGVDIDGDGRQEIILSAGNTQREGPNLADRSEPVYVTLALGNTTIFKPAIPYWPFLFDGDAGDLNGDGISDGAAPNDPALYSLVGPTRRFYVSNTTDGRPNTMTSVKNELGGINTFKFTPSTKWTNTFLPYAIDTLTEIAANDGAGNIAKQKISYAGGNYDPALRRFLGFRKVTETRPCFDSETACPTIETTYRQDVASAGAVERKVLKVLKDGAGAVRSDTSETWSVNLATKPYRALNIATTTTLSEGGGSATLKTTRSYDAYGNLAIIKDYGRINSDGTDVVGDQVLTNFVFVPNTTAYIVDKPAAMTKRDGLDTATSDYIEYHHYHYDGLPYNSAPVRGELTTQVDYQTLSPTYANTQMTYAYDTKGNRISEKNALDPASTRTFDADGLFVLTETNPKGQVTAYDYDFTCGAPIEKTGIDTILWTYTYDQLCRRLTRYNTKSGEYLSTTYGALGSPTGQYISKQSLHVAGSTRDYSYFDGFGQVYSKVTTGTSPSGVTPVETISIESEITYDARGNVKTTSLPHYAGVTPGGYVVTDYDWADRPIKVTKSDGSTTKTAYSIYTTALAGLTNPVLYRETHTDEINGITNVWKSTRGQVIYIRREITGTSYQYESRFYDAAGRLTGVKDSGGAVWTNVYDMLGNRISATDPDLGTWTYTYDRANRLLTQTDARGVKTGMTYDELGRLKERKILSPVVADPVLTTNTYDQPKTGYYNIGKLTTSTNAGRTQTMDYHANGQVARFANGTHATSTAYFRSLPIYKTYTPTTLTVGTNTDRWQYDVLGRLESIPGMITAQTYEADGQTKAITYANGVTTSFYYDWQRRWPTWIITRNAAGQNLVYSNFTRDAAGRILTVNGVTAADDWT